MTNEEVIQKLNEMKNILMERGWGKADLVDKSGKVCLLGARNIAVGRSNEIVNAWVDNDPYTHDEVSAALVNIIRSLDTFSGIFSMSPSQTAPVYVWNDQIAKNFNDVLDLIDQTIIKQKELA